MKIKYLGHSAFEIEYEQYKILIDPFLVCCPNYNTDNTTHIFVTHGHSDHLGNAIEISRKNKAVVTAVFELANYCASKGANTNGTGLGGWIEFPFGRAIFLPAFHSSSTPEGFYAGSPAGILFYINNTKIFHAGDTCLNSEMKVLREVFKPDIAMLPVGGTFTMDVEQAAIASEWIGAKTVIPMHYNTFDLIKADVDKFQTLVSAQGKNIKIMKPGEDFLI